MIQPSVQDLLEEAGYGPWLSYRGFAAACELADAASYDIPSPIRRARFIAEAAADLARLGPQAFEDLKKEAEWATEAIQERGAGCEHWGSIMLAAEYAHQQREGEA